MLKRLIRSIIPEPLIGVYHYVLARLAAFWYKNPSEELIVIGVTGTNGKSTTVQFIGRLLESCGERVGWTTTASFKVADREWVNDKKMTMLGRFQTQKLLRQMVEAGCRYAIVETSSQGLAQHRHVGIHYDVVAFTNLTPEHIEAHGGFENYKQAKALLFKSLSESSRKVIDGHEIERSIVANLDDVHTPFYLSFDLDRRYGCHWKDVSAETLLLLNTTPFTAQNVLFEKGCTTFCASGLDWHLEPIGRFYLENALLAVTVCQALGFDLDTLRKGVEELRSVPGRLEKIDDGQPFTVIVDYAYEPAALGAVYEVLKLMDGTRVIHVVGSAGGGRDVARRSVLGQMSAEHDDIVIVTNEDPYDEDPMQIINDVADAAVCAGKQDGVNLYRILDRQEAIDFAVSIAESYDLVLITGKGSEPVMAVEDGKKIPWDDRTAVHRALAKRYGNANIY